MRLIKSHLGGFTLVELLVVISIISLLSTIVLASLNGARNKAKTATRNAYVAQLIKGLEVYYLEKDGYPYPPESGYGTCIGWETGQECFFDQKSEYGDTTLYNILAKYVGSYPSFIYDTFNVRFNGGSGSTAVYNTFYYFPGTSSSDPAMSQYACNTTIQSCPGYELVWYLPGRDQDCGVGYRWACGDPMYYGPYDLTTCYYNVPSLPTDVDNC